ncbi:hypothetical protein QQZ08_010022 [Neonectria magnoliae]|uniref:Uncharacterized protein n=1 Tax=Neonectria magnoliae TaxID=2732573 RepID=A0ABR1HL85_9HYPO
MFEKQGWDHPITALYLRGDPYETSDAVFGVKKSLVVDLTRVDGPTAQKYGVEEGIWFLQSTFVLASTSDTDELRDRNATEELAKLGLSMKLIDHLLSLI